MWLTFVLGLLYLLASTVWLRKRNGSSSTCPVSVNYHFSRVCNMKCGFCFHTAKTSFVQDLASAKLGLRRLQQAGMKKLNFAGGEPFLYPEFLGSLIDFCKEDLKLESVSIVSNGSKVTREFLAKHCRHLDILAISCDSFDKKTNDAIGRRYGNIDQVQQLYRIAGWCREFGIKFKLNSVICRFNVNEDMNVHISRLQPFRWKCFQVLMVTGENDSEQTLRDVRKFMITDEEFSQFCERHQEQSCLVPESNELMATSYLILDEYMCFLDKDGHKKSASILDVSVEEALRSVYWNEDNFVKRGGIYDWQRECVPEW